ncbi:MAG: hypothetical protein JWM78_3779 [Verrucomicrobiaceae bacterium]|nr:hypothetical protein [Verrucomicrobiaceae bacterium]
MHSRILYLTNIARQQRGIATVQHDPILQQVAQAHAEAMASGGYFDHVDRQLRGVGERLLDAGYNYRWAGENISAGKDNVDAVFEWWLTSAAHRANILKPEFTGAGFGYAFIADDRLSFHHYWVHVFAAPLPD